MLESRTSQLVFNLAKLFGFPIQLHWNKGIKKAQFHTTSFWFSLIRYSGAFLPSVAIFLLFATNGGVASLFSLYTDRRFSILDLTSTWILWSISGLQMTFLWVFYRQNSCHINAIIAEISILSSSIASKREQIGFPLSWRRLLWVQIIGVGICIILATISIHLLCGTEPKCSLAFQWAFTTLYFGTLFLCVYSIHQLASNLFIYETLIETEQLLQSFNSWVNLQPFLHPSDLLQKSKSIVRLFSCIENRIGSIIFFEILCSMTVVIFGVFQATNINLALAQTTFGDNELSKLLLGSSFVMLGIISCTRYLPFFRSGHNITTEMKAVKVKIEDELAKRFDQFSPNQLWEFKQVRENFGRPAAIQPLGLFDLNLSTAFATDGLLITYIVILIQFKLG
ncbi:uncharacterized protein LOC131881085 [Tigriopus californicus]|uniref:uncharacterized protein LOC131881085 n=1 Tax=Tigriopus californicus TaxID=6832 RepID=UPI0027DA63E2|nr:uncharacterized protein LOC131881085 [Tigriopus californicus]